MMRVYSCKRLVPTDGQPPAHHYRAMLVWGPLATEVKFSGAEG
jgi:hypothetical protein